MSSKDLINLEEFQFKDEYSQEEIDNKDMYDMIDDGFLPAITEIEYFVPEEKTQLNIGDNKPYVDYIILVKGILELATATDILTPEQLDDMPLAEKQSKTLVFFRPEDALKLKQMDEQEQTEMIVKKALENFTKSIKEKSNS